MSNTLGSVVKISRMVTFNEMKYAVVSPAAVIIYHVNQMRKQLYDYYGREVTHYSWVWAVVGGLVIMLRCEESK